MKSKSRILKYASRSKLMDITIKLGKRKFTFNLNSELQIDENNIEVELKNQPSYYGYLGVLKTKLQRKVSDLDLEVNKKYAELYFAEKDKLDTISNRAEAAKVAKYKVERNPLFIGMCRKLNKAKEELGIIDTCLNSFDQRSRMVQSINTNRRAESVM